MSHKIENSWAVKSAFTSHEPNAESPLQSDQSGQQQGTQPNGQAVGPDHHNQINNQMNMMFTKLKAGGITKNSKQFREGWNNVKVIGKASQNHYKITSSSAGFNMILIIDNATVFGDYYRVQDKSESELNHKTKAGHSLKNLF